MAKGIPLDKLSRSIKEVLEEYGDEVVESMSEIVPEIAKKGKQALASASPKKTGRYARGWRAEVEKGRLGTKAVIYGEKPTYRLAHLLEHGHLRRDGTRQPAQVHIAPVEDMIVEQFEKTIERRLSG